jgi:tetratricopeptide (TPR) repeat protein
MRSVGIAISFFFLAISATGQAAMHQAMIEKANQAYSESDYNLAISIYDSVLNSGYESSLIHFNLGNAYFKINNIPAAILYYEKARKLDPTDEDIRFNLDLANSRTIDKIDPLPEFFLKTWWKSARDIYSSDQWAYGVVLTLIAGLILISIFIISRSVVLRKISFWTSIVLFIALLLALAFALDSYKEYSTQSTAIIFTPTVTVKSSPSEGSVDLFVIHEGTKVSVTDSLEGWSEIRLVNGNMGWVRTDEFRYI